MKIAYVITRGDEIGGAQVHVTELATWMSERDHEVTVLSGAGSELADRLEQRSISQTQLRHLTRALSVANDGRALLELMRELRAFKPDLVSAHSSKAGILARVACKLLRIPVVFTAHGWSFGPDVDLRKEALHHKIEWICARLASHLMTVSDADRDLALRRLPVRPDQITTVTNGMPPTRARRERPTEAELHIVSVARFSAQKDHDTLVRAFAAADTSVATRLRLVGDGVLRAGIESLAHRLGVSDRVDFLGIRSDVDQVLADSDIFVLCSRWEGLPRSIIEAQRAGLPVIASRVGGVHELVTDRIDGLLVGRESVADTKAAIERLVNDPAQRMQFGAASHAKYQSCFTLDQTGEATLAIYEQALSTSSKSWFRR